MTARIRLTYSRDEHFRYIGHLDFQRVWERALRRSRLPVAYSQGFNPQARLNLACALPLGLMSQCEVLDFWLDTSLPLEDILTHLKRVLPPGIELKSIIEVDPKVPPLQVQATACDYEITLLDPLSQADLQLRIQALLTAQVLSRERRGKSYDLRPLIESLSSLTPDEEGHPRLACRLSAREGATGRPEELLSALGLDINGARVQRTFLVLQP